MVSIACTELEYLLFSPQQMGFYMLNAIFFYFFFIFLDFYSIFRCGHRIRDPAPSRMRYSYILIASSSESLTLGGLGLPGPQQLWSRPAYNHFGVRPNPTEHGLHALNPLLPGFKPRTCTIDPSRDSTVIADCWPLFIIMFYIGRRGC